MRTSLDPDTERLNRASKQVRGLSFKGWNEAIGAGLTWGKPGAQRRFVQKSFRIRPADYFGWDQALAADPRPPFARECPPIDLAGLPQVICCATVATEDLDMVLEKLRQERALLISVTPLHGTLEDYFLAKTKGEDGA